MNEEYLRDHNIIKEEFLPVVKRLDEKGVSAFSFALFFSEYLRAIIDEIEDEKLKETIIRRFMD